MSVALDITGHVARVTLSMPDSGNRIGLDSAFALSDHLIDVRQRDDVWVVVLDADGPDFCTGTDPDSLRAAAESPEFQSLRAAQAVADVEKPVVCAIQGAAHDQGLELALACDLRVADSTATFRSGQAASGGMPWDGGTQRLPRLIGRSRAIEMLLTGRPVTAREALEYNLVNEVVEPGAATDRAIELAKTIAGHGPIALRYLKEAVSSGLDGPISHGLRLEADLSFLLQSTEDRREGISSFLERRAPDYRSR